MNAYFDLSIFSGSFFGVRVIVYAFAVGILTCLSASVIGVDLVLKRYSMIGDGLSHVGFLALGIAALFGVTGSKVMYITFPVVIAAALLLMWLSESGRLEGDAATALVSVGTVAVGYLLFGLARSGSGDVCTGLFGSSILTLDSDDMKLGIIAAAVVLAVYVLMFNKLFAVTFDESFAVASGINVRFVNAVISVIAAVTVVVGMKLIGSIMISAVIVIPAVSAMRLYKSYKKVVLASGIISVICFAAGFLFAMTFAVDIKSGGAAETVMLPVGATIVVANVLVLLITTVTAKIRKKA